ncbi:MAG: SDR family NAD(P)-dependent oxidoreductase [Flavobacteriales bacterium]|nr:SDR family NAD(P)-dependent oxidoreductase [Flavobacteriales bacterium]
MSKSNHWKDKKVWITGASSGIGEAFAHAFAAKGAQLILSSRNAEKLNALVASLAGARHKVIRMDVSDESSINAALTEHRLLIDEVDVLVNNAGVSQRALTWEASRESERMIMETNFFGATALAKAVLPGMMKRNHGTIINMSSPAGAFGFPLRSSYSASKHALHGYFETLRAELKAAGKDIHILMALPGRVQTNMSVNAMTGDGSKQGTRDKRLESGITPEACARKIIQAAENGKAELYIGREQALIYIKRFFPSIFRSIVTKFKPD